MPRADDVPFFHFETRNVPSTTNALGIKGAGEAGTIGATPAVMNAVVDALYRAYGIRHIDMPATPDRVWQAIAAARGRAAPAAGLAPAAAAGSGWVERIIVSSSPKSAARPKSLFFAQFRTENRFPLLLELL